MPAKATIQSYDADVTLPARCRAVAKITQGKPERFRWQYQTGDGRWVIASDQPATDLDVLYQFPSAGVYPIRLQTLVNGVVIDQSSSTSRVVTVRPAVIPPVEPPEPPATDVPTYDRFVNTECPDVAEAFHAVNGVPPAAGNMGHNSYRRLAQGWTANEVQAGIVDGSLNFTRAPWFGWVPVDYDTFVGVESPEVAAAYGRVHPPEMGHTAWRRFAEFWTHRDILHSIKGEPLEDGGPGGAKPPLPPVVVRAGIVRGNTFQCVDDVGGWLPLGTSLFWGAYGYVFERDRIDAHLRWIASQGFDYVRVIATGLRKGTLERSLDPGQASFQSGIAGLTDLAWSYGLRVQWTVFGAVYDAPSVAERRQTVDKVCEALQGRQQAVWSVEIGNEAWSNGFPGDSGRDELTALVSRVRDRLPNLVAPTCPHTGDDITKAAVQYYYKDTRATVCGEHYSRRISSPEGIWRHTKKPWRESMFTVDGCCALRMNQEPMGPESSGEETNDPLVLATDSAVSFLSGVGAYLLHTGAGIYGVSDPTRGRPADIWDTVNITTICEGLRSVRGLLPADLPNWKKHKSNASDAPFGFVDTPGEQLAFCYSATKGQDIVMPVVGVVADTTFTLRTGTCAGTVYHPVTGDVLAQFTKSFRVTPSVPSVVVIARRTS